MNWASLGYATWGCLEICWFLKVDPYNTGVDEQLPSYNPGKSLHLLMHMFLKNLLFIKFTRSNTNIVLLLLLLLCSALFKQQNSKRVVCSKMKAKGPLLLLD